MPDAKVILGDCLDVLRGMDAGSVDAVVTDPPYNVGLEYDGYNDTRKDYAAFSADWLREARRVSRGPVAFTCGIVNLGMWLAIEKPKWILCWWKPASSKRSPVGFNNWEPILLYGKLSKRKSCDVIRTTEQAKLPVMHKKAPINHPCPKPVEWAVKQVEMLTEPGETVLDPFCGSGTVGIACVRTDRGFIGVDHSSNYVALTQRRLADAHAESGQFA